MQTERITLRITPALRKRLEQLASNSGLTLGAWIRSKLIQFSTAGNRGR
jgi:predicted HicB family RNase H-like nuclease